MLRPEPAATQGENERLKPTIATVATVDVSAWPRPGFLGGIDDTEVTRAAASRGFLDLKNGQSLVMVLHIIGLVVLGLLVGALGRLFHPGRDRMGILMTMAIGVASVVLAGLLIGGLLGFILAVVIGVVLVALWSHLVEARRAPKWKRALHVD